MVVISIVRREPQVSIDVFCACMNYLSSALRALSNATAVRLDPLTFVRLISLMFFPTMLPEIPLINIS